MTDSESESSSDVDSHTARIEADPFNAVHVRECEKEKVVLHLVFPGANDKTGKDGGSRAKDGRARTMRLSDEHAMYRSNRPASAGGSKSGSERRSLQGRASDEDAASSARPATAGRMPGWTHGGHQASFQDMLTPHEVFQQAVSNAPREQLRMRRSKSFGSSTALEESFLGMGIEGMGYSHQFAKPSPRSQSRLSSFIDEEPYTPAAPYTRPMSALGYARNSPRESPRPGSGTPLENSRSRGISVEVRKHLENQWQAIQGAMASGAPLKSSPLQSSSSKLRIPRPQTSGRAKRGNDSSPAGLQSGFSVFQGHKTVSQKISSQQAMVGSSARGARSLFVAPSPPPAVVERFQASVRHRGQKPSSAASSARPRTAKASFGVYAIHNPYAQLRTITSSSTPNSNGPTSSSHSQNRLLAAWHGETRTPVVPHSPRRAVSAAQQVGR